MLSYISSMNDGVHKIKDTCAPELILNGDPVELAIIEAYQRWNLPIVTNLAIDAYLYLSSSLEERFLAIREYINIMQEPGQKELFKIYTASILPIKTRLKFSRIIK